MKSLTLRKVNPIIMDIQAVKLELMQKLLNTEEEQVLGKVKEILDQQSEKDWWDELSLEEKQEIEEGLAQADNGELIPHETVMAKYKKWL